MKLTGFGKLTFFIMSYYLLFVIVLYDNSQLQNISLNLKYFSVGLNYLLIIALTLFVLVFSMYIFKFKRLPKKVFDIEKHKDLSSETLNYLVTLIIGLFFFDMQLLSLKAIVLLLLIYLVYQTGGIYYLQPLLILFGYRVYKCFIDGQNEIMLISNKSKIRKGKTELRELFGGVYLLEDMKDE